MMQNKLYSLDYVSSLYDLMWSDGVYNLTLTYDRLRSAVPPTIVDMLLKATIDAIQELKEKLNAQRA